MGFLAIYTNDFVQVNKYMVIYFPSKIQQALDLQELTREKKPA